MNIPDKAIDRLTLYHFILDDIDEDYVSSTKFAKLLDVDSSQVRKDLKYVDNQGKCRVGYDTKKLKKNIEEGLGFKQSKNAFIIGAGNLGSALAKYDSFRDYGLNIVAMFDNDPKKIGSTINGKQVFEINEVLNLTSKLKTDMAILTLPKEYAQTTVDFLIKAGIKYIWNFTPCVLDVPKNVKTWNENLIGSFLQFTNNNEIERSNNDD